MELTTLQQLWWLITSVVGSLFLFLTFVQGGQTLLFSVAKTDLEKSMVINSLGRKWELTFTTLVLFGGDMVLTIAGYHAGEGAVQKYGGVPPYSSTRGYVKKVLRFYHHFKKKAGG